MKILFYLLIIFLVTNCSKPKTVLICGDHICVNKAEADEYFEENLSIEVKIIDNKNKNSFDLVELNLNKNSNGKELVSISKKEKTRESLKNLTNKEKKVIREDIRFNKKRKKFAKKIIERKHVTDNKDNIVDICTLLKKCNIDEISKFLIKQGKKKSFPNINVRE